MLLTELRNLVDFFDEYANVGLEVRLQPWLQAEAEAGTQSHGCLRNNLYPTAWHTHTKLSPKILRLVVSSHQKHDARLEEGRCINSS